MPVSTPPLTPLAAAVLHVGAPERVLDVACGDGEAALFLSREFPRARIRGVDPSARAVRAASARVGLDPEGRIAFKPGRPRALPFPDEHFDLLTFLDATPAAKESARVLRTGGYLVLAATASAVPAGRLLRRGLARHGFEPLRREPAGTGGFAVYRLTDGGPGTAAV